MVITGHTTFTAQYKTKFPGGFPVPPIGTPDGTASNTIKSILETEDHIKYITGYTDGTVKPGGEITRAEVAMIFWRLVKSSAKHGDVANTFSDVKDSDWYAQAVKYLAQIGIIAGYEDGSFRPNQSITRAEFVTIAARFDTLTPGLNNPFSDLASDHWAYLNIMSAYAKGWVAGNPDGTFRPNARITRAEVVTIVNKMLGRGIDKDDVPTELDGTFKDLRRDHWAFEGIIEASVAHEFYRKPNNREVWTSWTK